MKNTPGKRRALKVTGYREGVGVSNLFFLDWTDDRGRRMMNLKIEI